MSRLLSWQDILDCYCVTEGDLNEPCPDDIISKLARYTEEESDERYLEQCKVDYTTSWKELAKSFFDVGKVSLAKLVCDVFNTSSEFTKKLANLAAAFMYYETETPSFNVDQIDKRIITLQSVYTDGLYLTCENTSKDSKSKKVKQSVTEVDYTDLIDKEETRFLVHKTEKYNTVVLESMCCRNYYLSVNNKDDKVVMEHFPVPPIKPIHYYNQHWALYEESPEEYNLVSFGRINKNVRFLIPNEKSCELNVKLIISNWRVAIGPGKDLQISDEYKIVGTCENFTPDLITFKFQQQVGVSDTQSKDTKISASLSQELSVNFAYHGAGAGSKTTLNYAKMWGTSESKTWHQSNTFVVEITVPAKKKMVLSQLQANYGPSLVVYSNHTRVKVEELPVLEEEEEKCL